MSGPAPARGFTSGRLGVAIRGARAALAAVGVAGLAACGGGGGGGGDGGAATLESIDVAPASATVAAGRAQALTATARWSDGSTRDVTALAAWSSSAPAIASVDAGVATGVSAGDATITAAYGGASGAAALAVGPAALEAVTVSPVGATVALGTALPLDAVAVWSDGSKADVTGSAAWASSDPAVAAVDAAGVATGVAKGTATISASYGGATGTAAVRVTDATLASLSIAPTAPSVPLGVDQPFTATGIFTDGTRQDLTTQVLWTSSAPGVAVVDGLGFATPVSPGTAAIGASLGAVSDATPLTVTDAVVTSLAVTPPAATVAAGTSLALGATATYSDATTQDLTALAAWTSSDPCVAVAGGVATGVQACTATVTATYVDPAGGTWSDAAVVTVTAATLESVTVEPAGVVLPSGAAQQLTATGRFSDGSTQDLTALASWTSSDPAIAAVSNAGGQEGLVTGISAGAVVVTATYAAVSGSAPVTVSGATLQAIVVRPDGPALPVGYALAFTATAAYDDGTERDVTSLVTWTSGDPSVATISNATGSQGLATGVAAGTAPITAILGGVSGETWVDVVTTKLQAIAVTPAPFAVTVKGTIQLVATGTFQDGTVLDLTRQCSWSTGDRFVARVSRAGVVTGVAPGPVTITAKKKNVSGAASGTIE